MADANSKSGSNYVRYVNISTRSDMSDGRASATLETAPRVAPRAAASQLERFTGSNEPIKSRFTSAGRDVTEQQWRAVDEGKIWGLLASRRRPSPRFLCLAGAYLCRRYTSGNLNVSQLSFRAAEELLWAATETTDT